MVGIHERLARKKIYTNSVAHIWVKGSTASKVFVFLFGVNCDCECPVEDGINLFGYVELPVVNILVLGV
jgi:hypothetical protein